MPDLNHFWQRLVQATALIFGLALGVAVTVFAYTNTAPVTVGWAVFSLGDVPLWTVAVVPLVLVLVAGTLYHWWNSFHHFTEHMRHRHRVHELEVELKALKVQLDGVLGMPDHEHAKDALLHEPAADLAPLPEPASSNGSDKAPKKPRKRVTLTTSAEPELVAVASALAAEPPKEANSEA